MGTNSLWQELDHHQYPGHDHDNEELARLGKKPVLKVRCEIVLGLYD